MTRRRTGRSKLRVLHVSQATKNILYVVSHGRCRNAKGVVDPTAAMKSNNAKSKGKMVRLQLCSCGPLYHCGGNASVLVGGKGHEQMVPAQ